jgi:hypothetical protein
MIHLLKKIKIGLVCILNNFKMKKILLLIFLIVYLSSCNDDKYTIDYELSLNKVIILNKKRQFTSQVYIFDGSKSNWYDISDTSIYNRLNIGDTLNAVILFEKHVEKCKN